MADEMPLVKLTDAQLREIAEKLSPDTFIALLRQLAEQKADASKASRQLDIAISVGLARRDVVNRRMSEVTGFRERALYKRQNR